MDVRAGAVADPRRATGRDWATLVILTLAVTLIAVDGTVLALAAPALTADLAPSATQLLWIGDIYSFVVASLLVSAGNLADRIGRKRQLLIGAVGFAGASALAAFAPTAELLIVARALLGVAAALLMPSTLSIIRNVFEDPQQRTRAVAAWSAGALGGAAVAPLLGGFLLEHFWWGSVFLINLPVIAVLVMAGVVLIPESRNPNPGRFDLVSAGLSIVAILPAVYAVKHLVGEGLDVTVPVAAVIGILAGWAFVARQRRLAEPMIDVGLFGNAAFSGAVATNLITAFSLSGLLFFFSQYLQLVRGLSPLQAGLRELPLTIASIAVISVIGWVLVTLGRGRAIATGLGVAAVGLVVLSLAEGLESYGPLLVALAVIGLGLGVSSTLTTDAVIASAPKERSGAASSISETAYELGVAFGIALLGSLLTVFYRLGLSSTDGISTEDGASVRESLATADGALATDPTPQAQQLLDGAREAFTHAMQYTSLTAAAVLAFGAVAAWRVIPSPRGEQALQQVSH